MAMLAAHWQSRTQRRERLRRGSDGLTDAERAQFAAAWRAGSGTRSTEAEMDRLQALALSRRAQQNAG